MQRSPQRNKLFFSQRKVSRVVLEVGSKEVWDVVSLFGSCSDPVAVRATHGSTNEQRSSLTNRIPVGIRLKLDVDFRSLTSYFGSFQFAILSFLSSLALR